jgi:transcriptional regulator with XRE-family HTH domain
MRTMLLPGLGSCRENAGLKQFELAELAGLTPETLCRYERQHRAASTAAAQRLAELLGVALEVLTHQPPLAVPIAPPPPPLPKRNEPKLPPTEKVCTECGRLKEIEAFTPIRACKAGHYGRCRTCRAARAKERYWSDPVEREKIKARSRHNRQRRNRS